MILGTRFTHAASFFVRIDCAILREVAESGEVTRNTDVAVPASVTMDWAAELSDAAIWVGLERRFKLVV